MALEGAAAKCTAAASKVTALTQGEPLGADGYSGQQGGEAARPNRLSRLPSLLVAMGGRGQLREASHTIESSEQPEKIGTKEEDERSEVWGAPSGGGREQP